MNQPFEDIPLVTKIPFTIFTSLVKFITAFHPFSHLPTPPVTPPSGPVWGIQHTSPRGVASLRRPPRTSSWSRSGSRDRKPLRTEWTGDLERSEERPSQGMPLPMECLNAQRSCMEYGIIECSHYCSLFHNGIAWNMKYLSAEMYSRIYIYIVTEISYNIFTSEQIRFGLTVSDPHQGLPRHGDLRLDVGLRARL